MIAIFHRRCRATRKKRFASERPIRNTYSTECRANGTWPIINRGINENEYTRHLLQIELIRTVKKEKKEIFFLIVTDGRKKFR